VYQVDVKNGVKKIYNWDEIPHPNDPDDRLYTPEIKADGPDRVLRHTFSLRKTGLQRVITKASLTTEVSTLW
jgi:hypothetical protein